MRRVSILLLVASSGCGRSGFAPVGDVTIDGRTDDGELGDGPPIPGAGARALATGLGDACAISPDGRLRCWGGCSSGECGLGDSAQRLTPTPVGTARWREIAMGRYHACGIQADGTLWCWGTGTGGALGLGATTTALVPTRVGTQSDSGELGLMDTIERRVPVPVGTQVWAEVSSGASFTCAPPSVSERRRSSLRGRPSVVTLLSHRLDSWRRQQTPDRC